MQKVNGRRNKLKRDASCPHLVSETVTCGHIDIKKQNPFGRFARSLIAPSLEEGRGCGGKYGERDFGEAVGRANRCSSGC